MRNLKKFLALVLALMMIVSVMVTVNAASATTDDYDDAVETLELYKVLKGNPDGDLHVKDSISRAEMAAIVYRVLTGDTTSSDQDVNKKFGDYVDKYGFTDVSKTYWARGYIGWCANAGIMKGNGNGTVAPTLHITGYEVRAMLLRAMGYDKNNEFTGGNWQYNVLSFATKAGINAGVTLDPGLETPRGAVAQLTYNAACDSSRVTYDEETKSYDPYVKHVDGITWNDYMPLIAEGNDVAGDDDDWGVASKSRTIWFTWPNTVVKRNVDIPVDPLYQFWGVETECDIAKEIGLAKSDTYDTYINGNMNLAPDGGTANPVAEANADGKVVIVATDTVGTVGAPGRWTRVYEDRIVYVDTFLAKVTGVTSAVTDEGGHVLVKAGVTATVYAAQAYDTASAVALANVPITGSYAVGDVLAVQILTDENNKLSSADDIEVVSATKLSPATVTVKAIDNGLADKKGESFIGSDNKTYTYNSTFGYNALNAAISDAKLAGTEIGRSVQVYADAKGYVLGVVVAPAVAQFGVVTKAVSKSVGEDQWVVEATVLSASGSTVTVQLVDTTSDKPWTTQNAAVEAIDDVKADVNSLVKIDVNPDNSKYYIFTKASDTTDNTNKTLTAVWAGQADTISGTNDILVNDKTVFFVAKYQMDNTVALGTDAGAYKLVGYDVKTGFQNIPDLSWPVDGSAKSLKIDGTTAATKALMISWFDNVDPAADDTIADYVLILQGVENKTNKTEIVPNYAFLANPKGSVKDYKTYYEYDAFVNGAPTTLKVAYDVAQPTAAGLYTYDESTNEGYRAVTASLFTAGTGAPNTGYTYADGVLTLTGGTGLAVGTKQTNGDALDAGSKSTARTRFTVASGAAAYIVNETKGTISSARYDIATLLNSSVYGDCNIWFQLDNHGWINVIYIVAPPVQDTPADTSELTLTSSVSAVTGNTIGSTSIGLTGGITLAGTSTCSGVTAKITATVEIWDTVKNAFVPFTTADTTLAADGSTKLETLTLKDALGRGQYLVTITATYGSVESDPVTVSFSVPNPTP